MPFGNLLQFAIENCHLVDLLYLLSYSNGDFPQFTRGYPTVGHKLWDIQGMIKSQVIGALIFCRALFHPNLPYFGAQILIRLSSDLFFLDAEKELNIDKVELHKTCFAPGIGSHYSQQVVQELAARFSLHQVGFVQTLVGNSQNSFILPWVIVIFVVCGSNACRNRKQKETMAAQAKPTPRRLTQAPRKSHTLRRLPHAMAQARHRQLRRLYITGHRKLNDTLICSVLESPCLLAK